jgi:hypothetical protein
MRICGKSDGKQENSVVTAGKALQESTGKSVRSTEWKLTNGLLLFQDHIYICSNAELCQKIVEQHHDTKIVGHPGHWKTLELVARSY